MVRASGSYPWQSEESHLSELPATLTGDNFRRVGVKKKSLRNAQTLDSKLYLCFFFFTTFCMKYRHLNSEQRYAISILLQGDEPMSLTKIAKKIGVNKSTVSRELKRNRDKRSKCKYNPDLAQRKADKRMKERHHVTTFTEDMRRNARRLLIYMDFSPEQIAGRYRLLNIPMVSHETLYQWIWKEKRKGNKELAAHLRRQGRRYTKRGATNSSRGIIKDRVGIEQRPQIVNEKKRFGDFEIDTMIGRNHKGAIMTANDRCTHIVVIRKLEGKEAGPLADAAIDALSPYKQQLHTITADNGKEFAKHKEIAEGLDIRFYFARPYHSWERGANENTNGLIRQYIPKGTDFSELTEEQIREVEWKLNNRPRKSLGYLTPLEYYEKIINFETDSDVALSN